MVGYLVSNKKKELRLHATPPFGFDTKTPSLVSFVRVSTQSQSGGRVILSQGFTNISLVIGFYQKKKNVNFFFGQKISFLLSKTSPKFHPFKKKIGQKISFLLSKISPKFHPFKKKNWTKNFFSFVKNKSQISPILKFKKLEKNFLFFCQKQVPNFTHLKKNLGESVATGYTCNGPVQKPSSIKSKSVWGG
jgi:hypothetical protein